MSIPPPHDEGQRLRNPKKETIHRAIHQAVRYYLEHSTKDRNAAMRMGKAEGFVYRFAVYKNTDTANDVQDRRCCNDRSKPIAARHFSACREPSLNHLGL